jgi:hypothetical protein
METIRAEKRSSDDSMHTSVFMMHTSCCRTQPQWEYRRGTALIILHHSIGLISTIRMLSHDGRLSLVARNMGFGPFYDRLSYVAPTVGALLLGGFYSLDSSSVWI